MLKTISCSKAKIIATEVINGAIMEDMQTNGAEYEDISIIKTGSSGEVLSVSLNMCRINGLKSRINLLMQKKLFESSDRVFHIALGTLLGWEIFNGQGIKIPVNISSSGSVNSDFRSEFSEAGINQTLHRVYLQVKARISVMIPGDSCVVETETDMLVSETVIVGSTPQMCTGVSPKCMYPIPQENKND